MSKIVVLLLVVVGCIAGGCESNGVWGVQEVVLVHNNISGTVLKNIRVDGVSPYRDDEDGKPKPGPMIETGGEIQVPVRYPSGQYVEIKLDVYDERGRTPLGVARRRVYIGGNYGRSQYRRSPDSWIVQGFERIVSRESAGR